MSALLGALLVAASAVPPVPSALAPGAEFRAELQLLFRAVACASDEPPAGLDAAVIEEHCRWLRPRLDVYRREYLARATPFFAALLPKGLPTAAVYPFGGGDLLSALVTYPDAREITTISLEHVGDPRRIASLDAERLRASLNALTRPLRKLLTYEQSTSENLMQTQRGDLPGQLCLFLAALAAHDMEPVSLRFFHLRADGSLEYLSQSEIAAEEDRLAPRLNRVWKSPDFSEAFSNAELTYRPRGGGDMRVHRHIAFNLANASLRKDPSLLRHLEAKGKVAAMTKAGSYLLWTDSFSDLRDYLLGHMAFMVSDSTGVSPERAKGAGFETVAYGRFTGPFLAARRTVAEEYRDLYRTQPYKALPFRYGYPDAARNNNLVVMRPASR